jgi:RNA-directed DNA polymerase
VVEGDIEACFDTISHPALTDRVRQRVGDKRVLALVKAFLKAGILTQDGQLADTQAGTPQGGILSPLLANIALSVLDEHFTGQWQQWNAWRRAERQRKGQGTWRLVRYADDFLILVSGDRHHAEALRAEAESVLAPMGMRLSMAKTRITHIDDGFDFLGWRIQRHVKKGSGGQRYVYTYPAKKSVTSIAGKIKALCRQDTNLPLDALNPVLRKWTSYFRPGVSFATFDYLRAFAWKQVIAWIRRKHRRITWRELRRRYCGGGWWPSTASVTLFNPTDTGTSRYRYRERRSPRRGPVAWQKPHSQTQGLMESRMRGDAHVRFGRGPAETGRTARPEPRCGPTSHGQDKRRAGHQPARLRRDRRHPRGLQGHPGAAVRPDDLGSGSG